jgi:hypothetical protein
MITINAKWADVPQTAPAIKKSRLPRWFVQVLSKLFLVGKWVVLEIPRQLVKLVLGGFMGGMLPPGK